MKKILFIESGVYEGGSFMSLVKHLEALDKNRFTPVIVFFNTNKWVSIFKQKGYDVHLVNDVVFSMNSNRFFTLLNAFFMKGFIRINVIPYLRWLHRSSIKKVESIIKSCDIDYVHLNTELFRDRVGLLAAASMKVPVISHLRSKYEIGKIHFSSQYIDFANANVSTYVAVSEDTASFWAGEVKIDSKKTRILYDYFEPKESLDSSDIYGFDGLKLVCPANIIPVKGHSFLLEVMANIVTEFNVKLFLLGRGESEYEKTLRTQIKSLRIEENVEFLGYQDNIYPYLQQADAVVLFSKREGLPNVIIESMGIGTIILATSVGGIPEIIQNNINGFLVPYGDSEKATKMIKEILMLDPSEKKDLISKAKQRVKDVFSKEHYQNQISKLYE